MISAIEPVNYEQHRMLAQIDIARAALAEAVSIEEVKDVRDKVEAIRGYYKQRGGCLEMQNNAAELKLRAERRLGELLRDTPKLHGARPADTELHDVTPLSDLGIERIQSHRWQRIASIPTETFDQRIAEITKRNDELTTIEMLRLATRLERQKHRDENQKLIESAAPLPQDARFKTIVIDPPWDWRDQGAVDQFGRTKPDYATMRLSEIEVLPIPDLAEPNAHLYLWVTNYCLRDGLDLCDLWGFRYITLLTWCKPSIGVGNYFRVNTEHVIFGVRGSMPILRNDMGTHFTAPREGPHSTKPTAFYEIVEACSPGPWLEMFARTIRPGWTQWGERSG